MPKNKITVRFRKEKETMSEDNTGQAKDLIDAALQEIVAANGRLLFKSIWQRARATAKRSGISYDQNELKNMASKVAGHLAKEASSWSYFENGMLNDATDPEAAAIKAATDDLRKRKERYKIKKAQQKLSTIG